jgi:hypothetical protein
MPFRVAARLCGCCKRLWNPTSSWWIRQLVQIQGELPLVFHGSEMFRHVDSCKYSPLQGENRAGCACSACFVDDMCVSFGVLGLFMATGWRQGYWRFFAIVYAIDATLLTFSINFQTYAQPCNSGNGQGIPTPGKKLCRAVADMQRWEVEKCALGTFNNVTICKNDTFSRGFQYSVIFEKHLDGPRS